MYRHLCAVAGRGATVTASPAPPAAVPATPAAAALHVLVADDNVVNQELARAMLGTLGHEVEVVDNGELAVAAVAAGHYSLVLMDCQMPVLDGFAATRAIRAAERARGAVRPVPIVALTANALAGDREECLASGMNDYLSKPFNLEQLCALIDRVTRPSEARASA